MSRQEAVLAGRATRRLEVKKELVRDELQVLRARLSLPDGLWEDAERTAAVMVDSRVLSWKPPRLVAVSSLYACCRRQQAAVGLHDLARASGVDRNELAKGYNSIVLNSDVRPDGVDLGQYVARIAEKTNKSWEAACLAQAMVLRSSETGLEGRNPFSIAAAALYVACLRQGERATEDELADAAGVNTISVRESIKRFRRLVDLDAPYQQEDVPAEPVLVLAEVTGFSRAVTGSLPTIDTLGSGETGLLST